MLSGRVAGFRYVVLSASLLGWSMAILVSTAVAPGSNLVAGAGGLLSPPRVAPTAATTPGPQAATVRGGINLQPGARPWLFSGPNPDSLWCEPPTCTIPGGQPEQAATTEFGLAGRLGVVNVRQEFPWFLVEPRRNVFDWSRSDMIFGAAEAAGVSLNPVLVFSPAWAASEPTAAPAPGAYAGFVSAFVHRYHAALERPYAAIEMWNEPDNGHYWNSGEAAYVADVLNPGYEASKAADPAVRVEMGGPVNDSGRCCAWLDGLLAAGGRFDIAAFHDYLGGDGSTAIGYRAVLDQHGIGAPVWDGEYGVQETTRDDTSQVHLFTKVLTTASPIAVAQWYNLRDDNAVRCCPAAVAKTATWGLVEHDDTTMKLGFAAMRTLLRGPVGTAGPSPSAG